MSFIIGGFTFTQLAADNFHRADGPVGANWTAFDGIPLFTILSNLAVGDLSAGQGFGFYTGVSVPNDQYATLTLSSFDQTNQSAEAAVFLRVASDFSTFYSASIRPQGNGTSFLTVSSQAGTIYTGSPFIAQLGDVLLAAIVGTTLIAQYNGVTVLNTIDTASASGMTGLFVGFNGGSQASISVSNFTVGSGVVTPTLVSIAITPTSVSIAPGGTQQYTAIGTYSDSSTADITAAATWASSVTGVATIASGGLATSISAGTTNITASLSAITSNIAILTIVVPTKGFIPLPFTQRTTAAVAVFAAIQIAAPAGAQQFVVGNAVPTAALQLEYSQLLANYTILRQQDIVNQRAVLVAAVADAVIIVGNLNTTLAGMTASGDEGVLLLHMQNVVRGALKQVQDVHFDEL
jgi:hypothetical protein